MENNFYLTQVDIHQRAKSLDISSKSVKNSKNSAYLAKNKGFYGAKKNMLEYIIREETQYADLEKCEDFYEQLFIKNYQDVNIYTAELNKKKKKLKEIDEIIEKALLKKFKI